MSKLTDVFKNTVVKAVGAEEQVAVQKAMFSLGFKNNYGENRVAVPFYTPTTYFHIDKDCRISHGMCDAYPGQGLNPTRVVYPSELVEAVVEHKAEKKAEKKASKKRKQLRKAGWIIWNGGDCPVAPDSTGSILLRTHGYELENASSGSLNDLYWEHIDSLADIIAYKLDSKKIVSQEAMVADIVASAGGVEVEPTTVTMEEMMIEIQTPFTGYKHGEAGSAISTNPKKQFGDKSIPLNLWPALASAYGALGLYNGKLKYGLSNFNATPVEASIYIAGAKRHLEAWGEGEEFDPADGVPNLGGVLANIAILLEARAAGTLIDDRKLGSGYLKEREALKAIVASLQVLHADKNPRHYTLADAK